MLTPSRRALPPGRPASLASAASRAIPLLLAGRPDPGEVTARRGEWQQAGGTDPGKTS